MTVIADRLAPESLADRAGHFRGKHDVGYWRMTMMARVRGVMPLQCAPHRQERGVGFPREPCTRRDSRYRTGTQKNRGPNDDLVPWIENRLQDHVAGARGADRHKDVLGGEVQTGLSAQLFSDGLANLGVTGIGHIAMRAGRLPATIRRNASTTAGGGSTSGLPSEKSKTASAPRSRLSRVPSSNMRRIQEAFSSCLAMIFEMGMIAVLL